MPGSQPQPGSINEGCSFYDRCNLATDNCKKNSPDLEHIKELDTNVRCFNYKELINQNNNLQTSITKKSNNSEANEVLKLKDVSISYAKQKFFDQLLNKISDQNPTVKDINIDIKKGCLLYTSDAADD